MNPKQDTHKENHTKAHHNQIIENKYQRKKIYVNNASFL